MKAHIIFVSDYKEDVIHENAISTSTHSNLYTLGFGDNIFRRYPLRNILEIIETK